MIVRSIWRNILYVNMTDPFEKILKSCSRIFSRTKEMPDIKVETDNCRLDIFYKRFKFTRIFHQKIRLWLHQNFYPKFFRQGNNLVESFVKQSKSFIP